MGHGYTTNTKMKKVLYLLIVCLVALSSCKKEDNNAANSLQGTSWEATSTYEDLGITFNANNKFTERYVYRGNNQYQESYDYGTYTYNPPVVTLTYNDGYVLVGRIDGDRFNLEGETLYKK